jgi:hypothetical protein
MAFSIIAEAIVPNLFFEMFFGGRCGLRLSLPPKSIYDCNTPNPSSSLAADEAHNCNEQVLTLKILNLSRIAAARTNIYLELRWF